MLARRLLSTTASLPPNIRQLLAHPPTTAPEIAVQVNGWVKSIRRQKKVVFAVISDGSSESGLQAVFPDVTLAKHLTNGASVRLSGKLIDSPASGQAKELRVSEATVLGGCDPETYPMQKQALTVEYLRDNCHLRARTREIGAMLRLRDSTTKAINDYFHDNGFVHVHTPIITSNDCEGAGETFHIVSSSDLPTSPSPSPTTHASSPTTASPSEYFNHPAYLTVSSQLHLEAVATAISRVYTLSPCFRAERSQTSRHLAEFWMLEAEWAFTASVADLCVVVEGALRHVLRTHAASPDMAALWRAKAQPSSKTPASDSRLAALLALAKMPSAWARMSYTDAVAALAAHHAATRAFVFAPEWGKGLQSEHERWLAEEHVRGPVFVTDYPAALKPFYMRANDDDASAHGPTVACFDLLVPGIGELVGGSLREERLGLLEAAIERHGLNKTDYAWYLDLRKYGGAPHGGFGMGFERLISWISGIESVRECVAMPRWAGRMLL
ncbi:asparaginyl-tRNA synthetase [Trametes gibbosa]|nr:asparaginyl-tRNA synthetase [Trametes gibbosa]